jgi:hypothetical protein
MKWLKRWKTQTLPLAVIGQGFSTENDDQDANGILAYSFVRTQSYRILFWNIFGLANCFGISDCFCPGIFSGTCLP